MHLRADTLSLPSNALLDVGATSTGGMPGTQRPEMQAAVGTLMDAVARSVKQQAGAGLPPSTLGAHFTDFTAASPTAPPLPGSVATTPRTPSATALPAARSSTPVQPPGSQRCPQPALAARKNCNDEALNEWQSKTHSDLQCPDLIKAEPGRSASEIVNANPVFKQLGKQKDLQLDALKERFGDWENEPDPQRRADAAERMSQLLTFIKSVPDREGGGRGAIHTSPQLVGMTHDGKVREGTEASILKNFALTGQLSTALEPTNDRFVCKDGSTRSNSDVHFRDMAGGMVKGVSGVLNAVTTVAAGVAGMVPGLGRIAAALLQMSAGAVSNYASVGAEVLGKNLSDADKQRALDEAARATVTNTVSAALSTIDSTGIGVELATDAVDRAMQAQVMKREMKKQQGVG